MFARMADTMLKLGRMIRTCEVAKKPRVMVAEFDNGVRWCNLHANAIFVTPPEINCELQDIHELCENWAKVGECENNPEYMVGNTGTGLGQCRRSCRSCEVCKEGDVLCQTRNREALGFLLLDQLD
jgi:hypothetical protein